MSKTAFGLSGTPTLTLVQFYNGKHKGRISPPFVFFYLISPRAFIDAFSFSILSSLILTSGRRHSPTSKPIRLRASLTGIGFTSLKSAFAKPRVLNTFSLASSYFLRRLRSLVLTLCFVLHLIIIRLHRQDLSHTSPLSQRLLHCLSFFTTYRQEQV